MCCPSVLAVSCLIRWLSFVDCCLSSIDCCVLLVFYVGVIAVCCLLIIVVCWCHLPFMVSCALLFVRCMCGVLSV